MKLQKFGNTVRTMTLSHKPFVYFGTPYVSRDTLEALFAAGFIPSLVVTSPDAPKGRGQELQPSETKEWALAHELPVFTPEKFAPDAIEKIRAVGAEYGIVVAYGKILPKPLIDIFPLGLINIHYSLLPKYRGASPVESVLLNEETVTGVAIQQMVHELDAGDILASEEVPIVETETTRELRPRLIAIGAQLLVDILPEFEAGALTPVPQNHAEATKCGKIAKEDGLLDLAGDSRKNWNKYRAYAESPGTYFFVEKNGKQMRVKIKTARFENGTFTPERIVPEGKKETLYSDFIK